MPIFSRTHNFLKQTRKLIVEKENTMVFHHSGQNTTVPQPHKCYKGSYGVMGPPYMDEHKLVAVVLSSPKKWSYNF